MYKSANEIALEQKVQELEKEIEDLQTFERNVSLQVSAMMLAIMAQNESLGEESFKKLADLVGERARKNILKDIKKRNG